MSEQNQVLKCINCDSEMSGKYCSQCGRPQKLPRITSKYILSEIGSVFNFEKGIFFTIKELLIRPGISVRKFINEDRNRLVKPIGFIILCSLVYILAQQSLNFKDGYMDYNDLGWEDSAISSIMLWISKNYGFANIILATTIALWSKALFEEYGYNYFEILTLLYFAMGIQMLMFSLFGFLESISKVNILDNGGAMISTLYVAWAIGRFFDGKKKMNYFKAFVCYFFGLITFIVLAIFLGSIVEWGSK